MPFSPLQLRHTTHISASCTTLEQLRSIFSYPQLIACHVQAGWLARLLRGHTTSEPIIHQDPPLSSHFIPPPCPSLASIGHTRHQVHAFEAPRDVIFISFLDQSKCHLTSLPAGSMHRRKRKLHLIRPILAHQSLKAYRYDTWMSLLIFDLTLLPSSSVTHFVVQQGG
ncbi:uncharacterized protein BT62DRAFT_385813 [Guyanagaster necrorhizus]|uniref:Uncharacterized protein n=1 Tax=Guyanagaster necrorhizus TaxID=856835 RepID=A0A9P7VM70_9AGAR|nr:uncharacterized protein BT62DRAFT_385813 [Guyanagaster necrorhizus MCA 3950]KAG7442511.1 hypothetical protein BT62DRAFT_385813 [Guyanagaster necrorhizus MCA 3950]